MTSRLLAALVVVPLLAFGTASAQGHGGPPLTPAESLGGMIQDRLLRALPGAGDRGSGRLFSQCEQPQIRIRYLEGRNARNSVSDCEIEIDPSAPYTVAVLAQELWEWRYKRRTGRSIGPAEEIISHEHEVQAAVLMFPNLDEKGYRVAEAHQMLAGGSYDFEGWTHSEIFHAMRGHRDAARKQVRAWKPVLQALREELMAFRAANQLQ